MQANWTYIVIIICILLATGLVWQEFKRANKHWLLWRIAAIVIACAALACIALPLTYQSEVDRSDEHKTILLTAGFNADSLTDKNAKTFTFDEMVKKVHPHAQLITPNELNKTEQLHVYGFGLNEYELQQLGNRPLVFHPAKLSAGVTNISYNSKLKTGEALHIQGSYNNQSTQKIKLVLKGLNTGVDSVTIQPNVQATFALTTVPKTSGRVVYTLLADNNIQGSLPVQIDAVKPLRVLMLSASPDFENRFLKNWLSENGYSVAARSAISKDKFNTEFINIAQFPLDRLSAPTLNKFDVLIGDLSVLNALSGAESAALKQEVADNGLGVIVKADSTGKSSWLQRGFPVDRPSGKEPVPSALIINGTKSSAKLSSGSAFINYQNGTQPLVINAQNHILANSTISGSGKIVFTTLGNTFSWMLAGDKADYSSLWSVLISKVARKSNDVVNEVSIAAIPFVNEPVLLQVGNNKQFPVNINGENIASIQNPDVPFEFSALYWPSAEGWQSVSQNNAVSWWYTYPKTGWTMIQASAKIAVTKKYENAYTKPGIVTKQIHESVRIDTPKIYFYILLLAACTFLWIETKFS
ncbi:hypothetical protein [Mucilaginibacter sp.]|jgi:hypothetical protein|uniref:hypothetical protein n=1 Tax=Mucilaginibacter sp. TaxID=1882438 RepID=UPI0035688E34